MNSWIFLMVHVACSVDMFWLSRPFRKKKSGTWGEKEMIWDQLLFFGTFGICSGWWKKEKSHECLKIVQCFFWTCDDFNMTSLNGPHNVNDEFGKKDYTVFLGDGEISVWRGTRKNLGRFCSSQTTNSWLKRLWSFTPPTDHETTTNNHHF